MRTGKTLQNRIGIGKISDCVRVLLLVLLVALMTTDGVWAAAEKPVATAPASPASVVLSPSGGQVQVEETLPVIMNDELGIMSFVLPGGAENLQISVPGHVIARWT
ncbi:MAG: hypothetical protein PHI96_06945, partial [Desulfovibrio sp.]|nr:hypothetical protein [Desulfovibrio sp.]